MDSLHSWPAACIVFSHDLAPVQDRHTCPAGSRRSARPTFHTGTLVANHATRDAHTRGGPTARRGIVRRTPTQARGTAQTTALRASGRPAAGFGAVRAHGNAFQELHPCPATGAAAGPCPGYVVDHIVPLKRGGADSPENMQWQPRDEAKAKDRTE